MTKMSVGRQMYHLKRLGLPYGNAAKRKASWKIYQQAQTWTAALEPDGVPGALTAASVAYAAKHGWNVSPHFHLREFKCPHCGAVLVQRPLLVVLERTRAKLYPNGLTIVSGYRCATHNAAVGGIKGSAHTTGYAADIAAKYVPSRFRNLGAHGIGYKARHGLVTHLDVKPGLAPNTIFREDY